MLIKTVSVYSQAFDLGAVSFGVIGPDGTGLDYYAYGGETANYKTGTQYIDNGTAFDGLYTDNNSTSETNQGGGGGYLVCRV